MRKLMAAVAAISTITAAGAAQAQEWSGFYIGAAAGYGWGDDNTTEFFDGGAPSGFSQDFDVEGWTFGGYGGVRWDAGGWWLGVEGDIDWSGIEGDYRVAGPDGTDMEIGWLGSIRGVAGVPMGGMLLYGTAGFAFGDVEYTYSNSGVTFESASDTETGWTAGLGAEWEAMGMHPRIEVRYTDLGEPEHDSAVAFPAFKYAHEPRFMSVRFGAAWTLN
jgi:outer membrane immunogenic protein